MEQDDSKMWQDAFSDSTPPPPAPAPAAHAPTPPPPSTSPAPPPPPSPKARTVKSPLASAQNPAGSAQNALSKPKRPAVSEGPIPTAPPSQPRADQSSVSVSAPADNRSHGSNDHVNPFDEIPSWYDVPALDEDQLNPQMVPPRHERLGDTAGMANMPTRKDGTPGSGSGGLIWAGLFLLVFGGGAVLYLLVSTIGGGLFGSSELQAGDCFDFEPANTPFEVSIAPTNCDGSQLGEIVGSFEAVGVEAMPLPADPFWEGAHLRCDAMLPRPGFPLSFPQAETAEEWEAGDHTVLCAISFEGAVADIEEAFAEMEAEIEEAFAELEFE